MERKQLIKLVAIGFVMIFFLIGIYKLCKIRVLTHLSISELEWIDRYSQNDTTFFKNKDNQIDTMIVLEKFIKNSTYPLKNPLLKFETGEDYYAYACIYFKIYHKGNVYDCSFFVNKDSIYEPPFLNWRMGNFVSNDQIPTSNLDCMHGNLKNSKFVDNLFVPNDSSIYIESFKWCKKVGLKSYTLRDGEVYDLIVTQ
ncbi:MAG: hypothetical protein K2K25_00850 [Muribaculaceae bacterium]|nr:hypothetical protein [Muribaculaceae bacterium]